MCFGICVCVCVCFVALDLDVDINGTALLHVDKVFPWCDTRRFFEHVFLYKKFISLCGFEDLRSNLMR